MHRILFANSDQKLSEIYSRHLTPHFLVDSASDGLSALRKIKLTTPHTIISDYQLPLLSGISLLGFIRSKSAYERIPFIFLSNHLDNSIALSLGANDWLEQNLINPDYLLDRIYHHLRGNKYAQ